VALGALWGDGDEFEAEGGAGAFEVAAELAAVVDLDASDAVGPALEAFAEETLGVAAVRAGEEAGVRELAGRVDGAEVVARREGAVLVQGVDLHQLAWSGGSLERALAACVGARGSGAPAALRSPAEALDAAALHELAQHPADGAGADDDALAGEQDRELVLAARVLQAYALDGLAHLAAFPGVAVAAGGAPVGESANTIATQDRAPAGVAAGTDAEHAAGVVAGEATLPALIDPCHHQRAGARLGWHVVIGSSNGDVEAARQTEYSHAGVPLP